ncbi:hypothetical protein KIW84_076180 [Lathyrus oleraceus]|uniref:Retrovirus-related Pol polyprotein from transposon TNT 1-94-like beta-barrel domain-containing protein n=1 Tax=Pisum sativum TaxID=3888 RepID=A0A9D4VYG8_PEA|nr:hypothetical protein KIW84_076180 [Pisum sativum]
MYSDLENQSQIYELTLKLGEIRQGEDSVTKYFSCLKRIWQDLDLFNEYEWISPADSKHYKKMVDVSRVFKFLAGLNVDFDEVRGRILGRNLIPPIGEVFSEVRREESRRQVMLGKNTSAVPPPVERSALAIPHVNRKPLPNQQGGDKTHLFCDYCGRNHHTRETCYKLHGRPNHGKAGKFGDRLMPMANEADSSPCTKEQMDNLLKLLKFNSSLNIPTGFEKVRIVDGSYSSIAGKGNIKISEQITLQSVLHVPKFTCNLLSVHKLSKDTNCSVLFRPSTCVFQDQNSGKTIGTAREMNGLYYLDGIQFGNTMFFGSNSTNSSPISDQGESQCINKEDNFWETLPALDDIVTKNHPSANIIEFETGGETLIKDDNPELKVYVRKKFHRGGANPIVSPVEIQSDLPSEGLTDNLSSSSSSGNPSYSSNDLSNLSFPDINLPISVRKNIPDLDVPSAERKGSRHLFKFHGLYSGSWFIQFHSSQFGTISMSVAVVYPFMEKSDKMNTYQYKLRESKFDELRKLGDFLIDDHMLTFKKTYGNLLVVLSTKKDT